MRGINFTLTVTGDGLAMLAAVTYLSKSDWIGGSSSRPAAILLGNRSNASFGGVELGCVSMRIEIIDVFALLFCSDSSAIIAAIKILHCVINSGWCKLIFDETDCRGLCDAVVTFVAFSYPVQMKATNRQSDRDKNE